jgi:hypothetical protein
MHEMNTGEATVPNSRAAIERRRAAGVLTWSGPAIVLFARSGFAVAAQGLVAVLYLAHGSTSPWRDAGAWLPVYGTLIDAGCLGLLWWLTRREGIGLLDLLGFDRARLMRDVMLGILLIPACLFFILGGVAFGSLLIYGEIGTPQLGEPLPLVPALYAVLIWPLVWGFTEQMTYNGYLLPRFQVLSGSTAIAVIVVGFSWAFQHVVMPITLDMDYMAYRFLGSLPNSLFMIFVYLYLRRLLPLVIAHWLLDGATTFIGSLLPQLREGFLG